RAASLCLRPFGWVGGRSDAVARGFRLDVAAAVRGRGAGRLDVAAAALDVAAALLQLDVTAAAERGRHVLDVAAAPDPRPHLPAPRGCAPPPGPRRRRRCAWPPQPRLRPPGRARPWPRPTLLRTDWSPDSSRRNDAGHRHVADSSVPTELSGSTTSAA